MENSVKHEEKLTTIPYIDCSTIAMVADYYGVPRTTIKGRYEAHRDALDRIGVMTVSAKEVEELFPTTAVYKKTPDRCMVNYNFEGGQTVSLHVAKNNLFTKEAVDYIGTILKPYSNRSKKKKSDVSNEDSPTPKNKKTGKFRSKEEQKLCINLAKAFASGDAIKLIDAALNLDVYRREQLSELTQRLSDSTQESEVDIPWTKRASANKVVRVISDAVNISKTELFNKIYFKLIYDYKLTLEERKIMPLINAIKDDEWYLFYQAVVSICTERLLDVRQVFRKARINTTGLSVLVNFEGGYNE